MYRYKCMIVCNKIQFIASPMYSKPTISKFEVKGRLVPMGLSVLTHNYGVRRGPVDKAPSCCILAQGSILGPASPEMGSYNADEQTHRTPHQNTWMLSGYAPTNPAKPTKKLKKEFGTWEIGGYGGSAPFILATDNSPKHKMGDINSSPPKKYTKK
jgi:hypothetical protein